MGRMKVGDYFYKVDQGQSQERHWEERRNVPDMFKKWQRIADGNGKWCSHVGKHFSSSSKSWTKLSIEPVKSTPSHRPKRNEDMCLPKDLGMMSTAVLFITANKWKQPKCLSVDEWIKKIWYIHAMKYYSDLKRNKSADPCKGQHG